MEKITYTYIPINDEDEGMTKILFSKENMFANTMMIENAARGIYIDPEINDIAVFATKANLEDKIKKLALDEEDYDIIMLNGFDISLDEVRDIYIDLAIKYDIKIYINVLTDKVDTNIAIHFDYSIKDISDAQWEGIKESAMNKIEKENSEYVKNKKINNTEEFLDQLLDFNKDKINLLEEITDLDIVESCSRSKDDEKVEIHKLKDNSILISSLDGEVLIDSEFVDFLKMSLQLLG